MPTSSGIATVNLLLALVGPAIAALTLTACDRGTPSSTAPSSPSQSQSPAPSTSGPPAGIKPHSDELPTSKSPSGPADGATAIGGMVGGKQDGGAAKGGAPAPTGGDGAAPKTEPENPKK